MSDEELVKIVVDLPNHWATSGEGLWARPLGRDRYEIANVPFYAYGLNYRDVVRASSEDPSLKAQIKEIIDASGHRTLRIIFMNGSARVDQQPYLDQIRTFGASVERANETYLAIDIPPNAPYEELVQYISSHEQHGVWGYETCEARVPNAFDDTPDPGEP